MAVTVKSPPKDLCTIECKSCGYELEYRPKDIQHHIPNYDVRDIEGYNYIECPRTACKAWTEIKPPRDDY